MSSGIYIPNIVNITKNDLKRRASLHGNKRNIKICETFYHFKEQPLVKIAPKKIKQTD